MSAMGTMGAALPGLVGMTQAISAANAHPRTWNHASSIAEPKWHAGSSDVSRRDVSDHEIAQYQIRQQLAFNQERYFEEVGVVSGYDYDPKFDSAISDSNVIQPYVPTFKDDLKDIWSRRIPAIDKVRYTLRALVWTDPKRWEDNGIFRPGSSPVNIFSGVGKEITNLALGLIDFATVPTGMQPQFELSPSEVPGANAVDALVVGGIFGKALTSGGRAGVSPLAGSGQANVISFARTETSQTTNIPRITPKGIDRVERHLDQVLRDQSIPIELQAGERGMLKRLRMGETTSQDVEFYLHELKESSLFMRNRNLAISHQKALGWRGVSERDLFHQDLIIINKELFPISWGEEYEFGSSPFKPSI